MTVEILATCHILFHVEQVQRRALRVSEEPTSHASKINDSQVRGCRKTEKYWVVKTPDGCSRKRVNDPREVIFTGIQA